jgi:hypothetical protein
MSKNYDQGKTNFRPGGLAASLAVAVIVLGGMATAMSAQDRRSIFVTDLTACFGSEDRTSVEGVVSIEDDSNSGRRGDNVLVVIEEFGVYFDYKESRRAPYELACDPHPDGGDCFLAMDEPYYYFCTYAVLEDDDSDSDVGADPNDGVDFDESITIGYVCDLVDDALARKAPPASGYLRVTAETSIESRDKFFSYSSDYVLDGRKALGVCD